MSGAREKFQICILHPIARQFFPVCFVFSPSSLHCPPFSFPFAMSGRPHSAGSPAQRASSGSRGAKLALLHVKEQAWSTSASLAPYTAALAAPPGNAYAPPARARTSSRPSSARPALSSTLGRSAPVASSPAMCLPWSVLHKRKQKIHDCVAADSLSHAMYSLCPVVPALSGSLQSKCSPRFLASTCRTVPAATPVTISSASHSCQWRPRQTVAFAGRHGEHHAAGARRAQSARRIRRGTAAATLTIHALAGSGTCRWRTFISASIGHCARSLG